MTPGAVIIRTKMKGIRLHNVRMDLIMIQMEKQTSQMIRAVRAKLTMMNLTLIVTILLLARTE